MHLTIYFNDKPLFLCDAIDATVEPYLHHDDAVFMDEFSHPAVHSMLHEMKVAKVHAGVFLHESLDALKQAIWKRFQVIQAAGGLVLNDQDQILFIFRRGKWDLPKGKVDEGESLEAAAVREVQEETGIQEIELGERICVTYHTYNESGHSILKESYWYCMHTKGSPKLIPQAEEQIEIATWVSMEHVEKNLADSFPSIREVMAAYRKSIAKK